MRTFTSYITKEFLTAFGITYAVLLLLCMIFDFLDQWHLLLKHHPPMGLALLYFLHRTPMFMLYVLPISMLLGAFISLGLLSRNMEILAMKMSGISIYRITAPLLVIALIVCLLSFGFGEIVVPYSSKRSFHIQKVEIKKEEQESVFKENGIWYRSRDAIYHFDMIEYPEKILPSPLNRPPAEQMVLKGITICYFDRDFSLHRRIDAKTGRWVKDRWIFHNGMITTILPNGMLQTDPFQERVIPLPERPSKFQVPQMNAEQMGFFELRRYSKKLRKEGYDPVRYVTDMHAKLSFSFFGLVLILVAIPFSLKAGPRGGNIALGIAFSMAAAFVYYVLTALGIALGHVGALPPFVAAWISNLLFGLIAVYAMVSMRQ